MIKEGERAPEFSGVTTDGTRVELDDYRGRQPLVVFFYPKDNTSVCTKEACSFRDHAGEIAAAGGAVLGVSMDSQASHRKFADGQRLNFPLVSDLDGAICKAFGVARLGGWLPPRRVTFVLDRDGIVRHVIASEFDANKHVDEALAALRALSSVTAAARV
jgi:peroxiredoxin Q/BCP